MWATAKQVVHVAQGLLIGADQQDAQVVRFALAHRVQFQRFLDVAYVDELVDRAVRVASDVAQDAALTRNLA
jgi:hypothetical protein